MYAIDVHFRTPVGRISRFFFQRLAYEVFSGEGLAHATLCIVVVNDREILALNTKFLGHNYATDVLTFPIETDPELEAEIYISADTARKQATEFKVPVRTEFARLAVHGILHLCGYDDITEDQQSAMHEKEDQYLLKIGI